MPLQVAPVLQQGTNSSSAYFPQGRWYNLYNYSLVDASSGGMTQTVQVRLSAQQSSQLHHHGCARGNIQQPRI